MINLSFDELRLIAQIGSISDYENKSKEDLVKGLRETPKPEAPKLQTPKPEPKQISKPETPKPEIRVNKRKLKNLEKIMMN